MTRVSNPGGLPKVQSSKVPEGRGVDCKVNYPKYCLLVTTRQPLTAGDSRLGGEPCSF